MKNERFLSSIQQFESVVKKAEQKLSKMPAHRKAFVCIDEEIFGDRTFYLAVLLPFASRTPRLCVLDEDHLFYKWFSQYPVADRIALGQHIPNLIASAKAEEGSMSKAIEDVSAEIEQAIACEE